MISFIYYFELKNVNNINEQRIIKGRLFLGQSYCHANTSFINPVSNHKKKIHTHIFNLQLLDTISVLEYFFML